MRTILASMLVLVATGASAGESGSVFGSKLRLDLISGAELSGELLAVERDSLLLRPEKGVDEEVDLAEITRVRVRRQGLSASGAAIWALLGGVVTGALLTSACSSVQSDCGGVFPAAMLSWGLVGAISAGAAGSSWRSIGTDELSLTPHARFPQGLPEDFGASADDPGG